MNRYTLLLTFLSSLFLLSGCDSVVNSETVDYDEIFSANLSTYRCSNNEINYEINNYPYLSKFISYERDYFISRLFGDDLRITVDTNILSSEYINKNLKRIRKVETNILELKIKDELYKNFEFEDMNFLNRVGFSKYSET